MWWMSRPTSARGCSWDLCRSGEFFFEGRVVEGRIGYSKENLKINKATMSYTESNNTVTLRNEKKTLRETQTLRAGCSKAEPKIFTPPQTPFPGRPKFNQLEMVTIFTYKPSLVRINARNFELSW